MVIVHQRPAALAMAGPSARIVTIKRENIVARPAPAPQRTRWQCSICGKLLSSKRSYDEHLNIHNQARPFTCDHCDYAAASQMTLRRHILRNHTSRDDWHYKCPYCGETYMEPASYQQHVSSRHFGRSATFGCPFTACTFQTKCSKHFREHLVKHHSCTLSLGRNIKEEEEADGSSSGVLPTSPSSLTDENLQEYLVDDDLGVGFGRRMTAAPRPIVRSNGEIETVTAATERTAPVGSSSDDLGGKVVQQMTSSTVSSLPSLPPPPRRMVVLRKTERSDHEMVTLPSSSLSTIPTPRPSPREEVDQLPITDDDFMKAPIALRRSMALPPLGGRMIPRRVQLAPVSRRVVPPSLVQRRAPMGGVMKEDGVGTRARLPSPATLGGSRHAPAMISPDAMWTIEHEEEVDEGTKNHVYHNGCIDVEID